jgi:hypothetical protein
VGVGEYRQGAQVEHTHHLHAIDEPRDQTRTRAEVDVNADGVAARVASARLQRGLRSISAREMIYAK